MVSDYGPGGSLHSRYRKDLGPAGLGLSGDLGVFLTIRLSGLDIYLAGLWGTESMGTG